MISSKYMFIISLCGMFSLALISTIYNPIPTSISRTQWTDFIPPQDWRQDDSWKLMQRERMEMLRQGCQLNQGKTNANINASSYRGWFYDPVHNVLQCNVHKAGSLTYTKVWINLARRAGLQSLNLNYVNSHYRVQNKQWEDVLLKNPYLVAVVRNPYERLVSSYNFFISLGKNGQGVKGTFLEFLENVVIPQGETCEFGYCPDMNVHWQPIDSTCLFCKLNYTVISKMETFNEDYTRIAEKLGENTTILPEATHVSTGKSIKEVTTQYFSQIPKNVTDRLNIIYNNDLTLFGYQPYPSKPE